MIIEQVRQYLRAPLILAEDRDRLIDSAPIPACTYNRSHECQTAIGAEHCGIMPSRKAKLFGFRAHLLATLSQVVDEWMLVPAAPHDSKVAAVFLEGAAKLRILGDNAYHDPITQEEPRRGQKIVLLAAQRRNAKAPWPKRGSCPFQSVSPLA